MDSEARKIYMKEYFQRPEVKQKRKEYYQIHAEEVKQKMKEYHQKPEVKQKRKEYYQIHAEEVKQKMKEYHQKPEVKQKRKEYFQRPEVKQKRKEYKKEYNQKHITPNQLLFDFQKYFEKRNFSEEKIAELKKEYLRSVHLVIDGGIEEPLAKGLGIENNYKKKELV